MLSNVTTEPTPTLDAAALLSEKAGRAVAVLRLCRTWVEADATAAGLRASGRDAHTLLCPLGVGAPWAVIEPAGGAPALPEEGDAPCPSPSAPSPVSDCGGDGGALVYEEEEEEEEEERPYGHISTRETFMLDAPEGVGQCMVCGQTTRKRYGWIDTHCTGCGEYHNAESFHRTVRKRRLRLGLSVDDMAARLGLARSTVQKYEWYWPSRRYCDLTLEMVAAQPSGGVPS